MTYSFIVLFETVLGREQSLKYIFPLLVEWDMLDLLSLIQRVFRGVKYHEGIVNECDPIFTHF